MFRAIQDGLMPALAEVGKIKVGGLDTTPRKGQGGVTWYTPVRYDSFEVRRLTRLDKKDDPNLDEDKVVMARLRERAGEGKKVTEIPCLLPWDDPQLNLPHAFRAYDGRKLWCTGDGVKAQRRDGDKGTWRDLDFCQCEYLRDPTTQQKTRIACKPHAALNLILPDSPTIGGVYVLRTSSWVTINNLLGAMNWIATLTGGILSGIPLKLVLIQKEHDVADAEGKVRRVTQPHVTLVYDQRDLNRTAVACMLEDAQRMVTATQASAANRRAMADAQRRYLAAQPIERELDATPAEDVAAEFHPPDEDEPGKPGEPGEPTWRPDDAMATMLADLGWTPGRTVIRLGELGGDEDALRAELTALVARKRGEPAKDAARTPEAPTPAGKPSQEPEPPAAATRAAQAPPREEPRTRKDREEPQDAPRERKEGGRGRKPW